MEKAIQNGMAAIEAIASSTMPDGQGGTKFTPEAIIMQQIMASGIFDLNFHVNTLGLPEGWQADTDTSKPGVVDVYLAPQTNAVHWGQPEALMKLPDIQFNYTETVYHESGHGAFAYSLFIEMLQTGLPWRNPGDTRPSSARALDFGNLYRALMGWKRNDWHTFQYIPEIEQRTW
jgi:hypothetical protein